MHTSVATQKLVTITMSVEEWADWLKNPQTFLVQIQNLALADVEPARNGNKPARARRSPKGVKAAGKSKKTGTFYDCPECEKRFKKNGYLTRHIMLHHAAPDAAD